MATDSKINRESLKTGLVGRYISGQKAGGAFDAYRSTSNTMLDAGNGSIQSTLSTINPGFQVAGPYPNKPKENFNNKYLKYSDNTLNGPVLTTGVNKTSTGWNGESSLQDALYTVDSGFKLQSAMMKTQLKDAASTNNGGDQSLQLSRYIKGFNSNKYTNSSFRR
jgi:hypothetical protein